jgi:Polysaccharide lyase
MATLGRNFHRNQSQVIMKKTAILLSILLIAGCNKKEFLDGPDQFTDDFESYPTVDSLISTQDLFWSFFQVTDDANNYAIDTTTFHSGNQSLRFSGSATTDELVSKCSVVKQHMAFWEGETMRVTAWYYLVDGPVADWLFIMDLEEQAPIGAGPGMRLAIVDDKLVVEHKYLNPNIYQTEGSEINFPRNQWVKVSFEALLSQKQKGYVKVWQDDQLIIDQPNWDTLPKDFLYHQQGTLGRYSSIELGLTATARTSDQVLYLDDVEIGLVQ